MILLFLGAAHATVGTAQAPATAPETETTAESAEPSEAPPEQSAFNDESAEGQVATTPVDPTTDDSAAVDPIVGDNGPEPAEIEPVVVTSETIDNPFAHSVVSPADEPVEGVETLPELPPERAPTVLEEPRHQEQRAAALWHVVGQLGVGVGLRLNVEEEFEQTSMAPFYLSAAGGVLLPTTGPLRFEARLAISANLSSDGTFAAGTPALSQWLITPSVGVRYRLSEAEVPDWVITGRIGVPIVVGPETTAGVELAGGASYNLLAGFGVYGELIYDVFAGGRLRDGSRTIHHLMALEVGARIDFEVLP